MLNKFSINNSIGLSIIGIQATACIYLYKNKLYNDALTSKLNLKFKQILDQNDLLKDQLDSLKSEINSLKREGIVPLSNKPIVNEVSESSTIMWFLDQLTLYYPQILFCTVACLTLGYFGGTFSSSDTFIKEYIENTDAFDKLQSIVEFREFLMKLVQRYDSDPGSIVDLYPSYLNTLSQKLLGYVDIPDLIEFLRDTFF